MVLERVEKINDSPGQEIHSGFRYIVYNKNPTNEVLVDIQTNTND